MRWLTSSRDRTAQDISAGTPWASRIGTDVKCDPFRLASGDDDDVNGGDAAARQSRSGPPGPRSAAAEPLDVSVRRLTAPRARRHWISAEPPRDFLSGDSGRGYTACRGAVGLPAGPVAL